MTKDSHHENGLPGFEMLFKVPKFDDDYTRITIAIILSIMCSLIVVLFKENKVLAKYLKYLHIDEIVYLLVGFAMAEVSFALLSWLVVIFVTGSLF